MKSLLAAAALLALVLHPLQADEPGAASPPASMDGPVVGVGIGVKLVDHQPVVDQVIPGNSAFKHGMKSGDRLLRIDGKSVEGLSLNQIAMMLRGAATSRVKILAQRPGEESPRSFSLTRQIVILIDPHASKQPISQ